MAVGAQLSRRCLAERDVAHPEGEGSATQDPSAVGHWPTDRRTGSAT